MQQKMNPDQEKFRTETLACDCGRSQTGVVFQGFLWPVWMRKANSTAFPPHGPRLYNLELKQCWHCSIKEGLAWHR